MNTVTLSADVTDAKRVRLETVPAAPTSIRPGNRFEFDHEVEIDLPAPAKARRPSTKRLALIAVAVLAGVSLIAAGRHWWYVSRFIQTTDDAYVGGDVTVIAPKVAGFVQQLAVADNQQVHAGDLLLKLDDRDYRAALAKAEAAVAVQKAALANLDATRNLQGAVVAQAQAGIAAADAEITRAHDDQVRAKDLLAAKVESVQEFQKTEADYKTALANGDKAHAALAAA